MLAQRDTNALDHAGQISEGSRRRVCHRQSLSVLVVAEAEEEEVLPIPLLPIAPTSILC